MYNVFTRYTCTCDLLYTQRTCMSVAIFMAYNSSSNTLNFANILSHRFHYDFFITTKNKLLLGILLCVHYASTDCKNINACYCQMVIVYDTTLKERISSITFEEERYKNLWAYMYELVDLLIVTMYETDKYFHEQSDLHCTIILWFSYMYKTYHAS